MVLITIITVYTCGIYSIIIINGIAILVLLIGLYAKKVPVRWGAYSLWFLNACVYGALFVWELLTPIIPYSLIIISILSSVLSYGVGYFLLKTHHVRIKKYEAYIPLSGALLFVPYLCCLPLIPWPYDIVCLNGYSLLLFIIGVYARNKVVRWIGYLSNLLALLNIIVLYNYKIIINPLLIKPLSLIILSFAVCWGSMLVYLTFNHLDSARERRIVRESVVTLLLLLLYYSGVVIIILNFDAPSAGVFAWLKRVATCSEELPLLTRKPLTNTLLAWYSGIYALGMLIYGLFTNNRIMQWATIAIIIYCLNKIFIFV